MGLRRWSVWLARVWKAGLCRRTDDAGSLAILMRPVGGGGDQQGAHLSRVGQQDGPLHPASLLTTKLRR